MMERARRRAPDNVSFVQGDVGRLPFDDESFDIVLSLNGFHAFPDKEAAYAETFRVLKRGGVFCGCFYVKGENRRTDWFVDKLYTPKGFFTPPYETAGSLRARLERMYEQVNVDTVEAMASFVWCWSSCMTVTTRTTRLWATANNRRLLPFGGDENV